MHRFDLDLPLVQLANGKTEQYWTTRNAVEGVQIFGGIGSGKTSGSGRLLALKYLSVGFGGLVLTVKPDEKKLWQDYCAMTGRAGDLIVVEPGGAHAFNFLDYEASHGSGGMTENIVEVLKTVIRASEEKASGSANDPFWETALDMLIFHVIDLCKLAYGSVSVQRMYNIVQSLPRAEDASGDNTNSRAFADAFNAARQNVTDQVEAWERNLSAETRAVLDGDSTTYDNAAFSAVPDLRLLKFIDQFFSETFLQLHEKTRSIIDFSFSGFLFRLLRDPVYSLFCSQPSSFTPEDCANGKIILIHLPVKLFHKIGRDSQIMFKYVWQRAMEKRRIDEFSRPVFLWADEAQNFLHEHDAEYQATARSSRIATVYISQNLPNYLANMAGDRADHKVKGFLGTLGTKIFHSNADIETNRYASELIGDGLFVERSETATAAGKFSASETKAVKVERIVRAEEFVRLKTGGPPNDSRVEGYMHLQGAVLANGQSHIKIKFNQKYIP